MRQRKYASGVGLRNFKQQQRSSPARLNRDVGGHSGRRTGGRTSHETLRTIFDLGSFQPCAIMNVSETV
jgi:hypothetical protein